MARGTKAVRCNQSKPASSTIRGRPVSNYHARIGQERQRQHEKHAKPRLPGRATISRDRLNNTEACGAPLPGEDSSPETWKQYFSAMCHYIVDVDDPAKRLTLRQIQRLIHDAGKRPEALEWQQSIVEASLRRVLRLMYPDRVDPRPTGIQTDVAKRVLFGQDEASTIVWRDAGESMPLQGFQFELLMRLMGEQSVSLAY